MGNIYDLVNGLLGVGRFSKVFLGSQRRQQAEVSGCFSLDKLLSAPYNHNK